MDTNSLKVLYAHKGELLTEMEIMQSQLQRINQQIIQIKNASIQQPEPEKKIKTAKDKK